MISAAPSSTGIADKKSSAEKGGLLSYFVKPESDKAVDGPKSGSAQPDSSWPESDASPYYVRPRSQKSASLPAKSAMDPPEKQEHFPLENVIKPHVRPDLSEPQSEDEKLAVAINDSFLAPIIRSEDEQSDVESEKPTEHTGWFEGYFVSPVREEMIETSTSGTKTEFEKSNYVQSINDSFFPPYDETQGVVSDDEDQSKFRAARSEPSQTFGDKKSTVLANIFPAIFGQESSASLPEMQTDKAAAEQPLDPDTPMMPEKIHPLEGKIYSSKPGRLHVKQCIKEILMTAVISVALTSYLLSNLYSVVKNYL
jgi:hypothetical protein